MIFISGIDSFKGVDSIIGCNLSMCNLYDPYFQYRKLYRCFESVLTWEWIEVYLINFVDNFFLHENTVLEFCELLLIYTIHFHMHGLHYMHIVLNVYGLHTVIYTVQISWTICNETVMIGIYVKQTVFVNMMPTV